MKCTGTTTQGSGIRLHVVATDKIGLCVKVTNNNAYNYGIKCVILANTTQNANLTKAFAVIDQNGNDQFLVWGDGFVHAREVRVTQNTFAHPDYVFENNYPLMSINELDNYLIQNKHLPDMPSADEVKKQGGINLGEMQEKQLQKIEELSLYIIDINKKVVQLQKENILLKEEMKKLAKK